MALQGMEAGQCDPSRKAQEQVWAGKRPGQDRHLPGLKALLQGGTVTPAGLGAARSRQSASTASQKRFQRAETCRRPDEAARIFIPS